MILFIKVLKLFQNYDICIKCIIEDYINWTVPGLRLLGPELVAVDPAPVDPDTLVDLNNTKVGKKKDRLKY